MGNLCTLPLILLWAWNRSENYLNPYVHIIPFYFEIKKWQQSSKYSTRNFFCGPFKIRLQVWRSNPPRVCVSKQEYLLPNHSATVKIRILTQTHSRRWPSGVIEVSPAGPLKSSLLNRNHMLHLVTKSLETPSYQFLCLFLGFRDLHSFEDER